MLVDEFREKWKSLQILFDYAVQYGIVTIELRRKRDDAKRQYLTAVELCLGDNWRQ